ncbi:MAG: O-antigen ligase family protein [Clostridia bacterium]|nr:O-antigen ligase family protein [Clostridia bacterium]
MIWIWAAIATGISLIGFYKQKIDPVHVIWILFAIDCYGVHIGGATIKLYMFFSVYLVYRAFRTGLKIYLNELIMFFIIVLAFILSDIVNDFIFASVLQHIYFIIILIEAFLYIKIIKADKQDVEQIIYSVLYLVIGFGTVCLFAEICFNMGINIPGIVSTGSAIGALIRKYSTMSGIEYIETYRLHGFESDPNSFNMPFLIGAAFSFYNLIIKKERLVFNCAALIISVCCIISSNSRGAQAVLLMTLFIVVLTDLRRRSMKAFIITLALFCCIGIIVIIALYFVPASLVLSQLGGDNGRSGLFDKYGRASIWMENLGIVLKENPFFGVGSNQIRMYSSISRACHNTWLEWICSIGIIQGLAMDALFIGALFTSLPRKERYLTKGTKRENFVQPVKIAYFALLFMLGTVDYIANTFLIFTFMVIKAIYKQEKNQIKSADKKGAVQNG